MPKLSTNATSSVLDKFERKITGQGAIAASRDIWWYYRGWYY